MSSDSIIGLVFDSCHVIPGLGSVVGRDGDETVQKHFMALVNGMTRKLDTYGIDVVKIGFKSLSILAKVSSLLLVVLAKDEL